ncbi:MAG: endo-1,4-beta-xylanase [Brasilonema angustatum HA4187-MV1]|jgi:GH35 family endo-1,4-beta-xylanase|nr:endo-1,4-beta-xylanase [Brasilonema angustatum HA4187-MV1]
MRDHNKQQKWKRRRQTSRILLSGFVSFLIVFGIHITLTLAQEAVPPVQQTKGNNLIAQVSSNDAWRQAAANNINTYRKGDLTVVVTNANGTPIPNADVHVAMKRHAYNFGSAVDENIVYSGSTNPDANKYRDSIPQLFNQGVIENGLKWPKWDNLELRPRAIETLKWLRDKNLTVRGHNLVWGSFHNSPPSLETLYNNTLKQQGQAVADKVLRDTIITHIRDEVAYLKGQINDWDVVNEPSDNHDFQNILGPSVIVDWFKAAHEADPNAVLYINENFYNNSTQGDQYESEIQYLLNNGAPLGGIGIESHLMDGIISIPQLVSILDRLAKFNLPIKITEFDIFTSDKQSQADITRDCLTAAFGHPATNGFIMWGFWDRAQWFENGPIYDRDWNLKLSGKVYMDLVYKEWWTDVVGKTDANGEYKIRGFLGDYQVTATNNLVSKTVSTTLSRNGTKLTIGT